MGQKMKLLIGYDGSASADAMLEDLQWAGLPKEGSAYILSAADVFVPADPKKPLPKKTISSAEKVMKDARAAIARAEFLAERAQGRVKEYFPKWTVQHEGCADTPAWAVIKKADAWKPQLVAVGAHGHSSVGRFLGSVSQLILTQAPCSVRIGRTHAHERVEKQKVLIGIDGSPDSKSAVEIMAGRSWPTDTEFILLSVIDPKFSTLLAHVAPPVLRWFGERANDEKDVIGRMLETFAKKLRPKGKVNIMIKEGDPKRMLVEEAEKWEVDTLVVGARGLGHMKRFLLGGVSTSVAARAHCSVEVVRS